jgi:hypothetical protein
VAGNVWLRRFVFCQCRRVTFPSRWQFNNKVIASMVNKTMECHVFLTFINAIIVIATFDLWMSWRSFDNFALVVNYINKKWEHCHVIVKFFEVHETLGATMAIWFKDLFVRYNFLDKVITYFKDKGVNQNTFTTTLTIIVCCVLLLLPQPYIVSFYGHAMSKCCQYVTNDLKVCGGMKEVSIKKVQSSLQKAIT